MRFHHEITIFKRSSYDFPTLSPGFAPFGGRSDVAHVAHVADLAGPGARAEADLSLSQAGCSGGWEALNSIFGSHPQIDGYIYIYT